ncbi:MAG: hypothetical protein AB8B83_03405 [Bdellovibrionales bacterium]
MRLLFIDKNNAIADKATQGIDRFEVDQCGWAQFTNRPEQTGFDSMVFVATPDNADTVTSQILAMRERDSDLPIFVISDNLSPIDTFKIASQRVRGILPADDLKPKELQARILQTMTGQTGSTFNSPHLNEFKIGDTLHIDTRTQIATNQGSVSSVPLNIVDCCILDHVAQNPRQTIDNQALIGAIFQTPSATQAKFIKGHVTSLRKKLSTIGVDPDDVIGFAGTGQYTCSPNLEVVIADIDNIPRTLRERTVQIVKAHNIVFDTQRKIVAKPRTGATEYELEDDPYNRALQADLTEDECALIEAIKSKPGATREQLLQGMYENHRDIPDGVVDYLLESIISKVDDLGVEGKRYFPESVASFDFADSSDFDNAPGLDGDDFDDFDR